MDFIEDFSAQVDKYSYIDEHKNIYLCIHFILYYFLFIYFFIIIIFFFFFFFFCIRGIDHPLIFNQCLQYFDSFQLSGCL